MRSRLKDRGPKQQERTCQACGALMHRELARYCLTCGKQLDEEYLPLDRLRSSNHMQGRRFLVENSEMDVGEDLFAVNRNSVSEMAWACFVYSLVPYLGILFVPATVIIGAAGYGVFLKRPSLGGGKLAGVSVGLSFVVFGIQIFLWWLLYIIPELSRTV